MEAIKNLRPLNIFLGLAIIVYIYLLKFGWVEEIYLGSDFGSYFRTAIDLWLIDTAYYKGYSLLLWPFKFLFEHVPRNAVPIHHAWLLGSLVFFCLWFEKKTNLLSALLFFVLVALNYNFIGLNNFYLSEVAQVPFILITIPLIDQVKDRHDTPTFLKLGFWFGLCAFIKPTLLMIFSPIVLWSFLYSSSPKVFVKKVVVTGSVFFMMLVVYGAWSWASRGTFVMGTHSSVISFYIGNNSMANGYGTKRMPLPNEKNLTWEESKKLFWDLSWQFRKENPERVQQLNKTRMSKWLKNKARPEGDFNINNWSDPKYHSKFLKAHIINFLGFFSPFLFLFLWFLIEPSKAWIKIGGGIVSLAGLLYLISAYFIPSLNFVQTYFFLQALLFIPGICFLRGHFLKRPEQSLYLPIFMGFHLYALNYVLYFFVKHRFRIPYELLWILSIALCFYYATYLVRNWFEGRQGLRASV